mgnify:CR=1 FL=1
MAKKKKTKMFLMFLVELKREGNSVFLLTKARSNKKAEIKAVRNFTVPASSYVSSTPLSKTSKGVYQLEGMQRKI